MEFITSFLSAFGFPGDWECIVDFCGSDHAFGFRNDANYCAWYSLSRKETRFGGQWCEVAPRSSDSAPSEDEVYSWVENDPCHYGRRVRAAKKRRADHEARMAATEQRYATIGYNWITCVMASPDGSAKEISQCVGIRSAMDVLRSATAYMVKNLPAHTRLTCFRFETGVSEAEVEKRRNPGKRRSTSRRGKSTPKSVGECKDMPAHRDMSVAA